MALLKVSKLGNPVLRKPTEPVPRETIKSSEFQRLLEDMVDTMHECDGVGLAANQVHLSKQIAVIEAKTDARVEQPIPLTVLINPKILAMSKVMLKDWEGCLSVNDMRGVVPRAEWVEVEALTRKGERVKFRAEGFFARVIQHECDHLAGKVFLDRMLDLATLTHLPEFVKFWHD